MNETHDLFARLALNWKSPIVARHKIEEFSGGTLSRGYMANLDSAGLGPRGKITVGGRVAYDVELLVEWMRQRTKGVDHAA